MSKKLICLVPFVFVLGLVTGTAYGQFFMQDTGPDGIVSMEAENFNSKMTAPDGHEWQFITMPTGFSGTGAMAALPNSSSGAGADYVHNGCRLDFEINFTQTGTHYLWVRGSADSGNDDTCHAGLDGEAAPLANQMSVPGSWGWRNSRYQMPERTQIDITTPGLHVLNIWYREDGVRVDKLVLTTNPDYAPTDLGPPESSRQQPVKARGPYPFDGATAVPRNIVLTWTPGELASRHDVYFGTSFDDVNSAANLEPMGPGNVYRARQNADSYAVPETLAFGQTYYWRIDEVGAAPDYTLFKGNIWSFTVEPIAYPIENITATASSANKADEGPENTVNGSGLDDDDLHCSENASMWLSNIADPNVAWIQYEFERPYKLHQMLVWNYNNSVEIIVGFSVREATIEYSVDGTNWTVLGTTHEFARGHGSAGYAPNTTVDLGGVAARYVKITAKSNWGGIVNQCGLSEIRFLYVPVLAGEPSPDSGATDIDVDAILSFRAGRESAKHDVYLGTDEQSVIDGNVPVATMTETSYVPSLDLAGTYYWRIDEVNDAEIPTTWRGNIWNFSTQEYLVVDDFESYNDIPAGEEGSNLVYGTWADGYENPANGSTVGYNEPFQPTMETSIFYDGQRSVPFFYDNTVVAYSEVTTNVADLGIGQDWASHGVKAMTLRFYGDPNNALQQMYVKINGSAVTYDGDVENMRLKGWQMWYIDLASTGVNLSNVTELAVGLERIGTVGGRGMVLLDGMRLYSYDRQLITPVDLGAVGLQAHYEFEGNTNDSSGNARNGTAMGSPVFVAGKAGQAISFNGINDYVNIDGYKGISGAQAFTVAAWIKTGADGEIITWGTNAGTQRLSFRVDTVIRVEHGSGNVRGTHGPDLRDNQWHHVAAVAAENSPIEDVLLYVDGIDVTPFVQDPDVFNLGSDTDVSIGRRATHDDRYFNGQIDDVHIYDYALSPAEVASLAGRTKPFDKPF
ncbi:MAG: discoidin domain-containing protein [Phycisphaerae bacterium]|nr:discoidin domain-containing protein [Phycisphaerae bacterium]